MNESFAETKFATVVTTIQQPTACVLRLADIVFRHDGILVVVGDKKGPPSYNLKNARFLSIVDQQGIFSDFVGLLPRNTYARKNVGFLYAMSLGAECLYETDDDNYPLTDWSVRRRIVEKAFLPHACESGGWVNVFRYFTSENIWPRGLPLDEIESVPRLCDSLKAVNAPIQQGLVNGNPDTDAIWRLTQGREFCFSRVESIFLPPGFWCPFNTQSTWFWSTAYPLMYIPSHCSFRMCDIWRSFVAQRCLWAMGEGVCFHSSEVCQERNPHDLMEDFRQELEGFLYNRKIVEILEGLSLAAHPDESGDNLILCYEALVRNKFFPVQELELARAWVREVRRLKEFSTSERLSEE